MNNILNYTAYPVLLLTFSILLVATPNNHAFAAVNQESKAEIVSELILEIENLMNLVRDRRDFYESKDSSAEANHDGRSEDFFLRIGEDSPAAVYGSKPTPIVIETDEGVRQIVVTNSCDESDSKILLLSNSDCMEETWLLESKMKDGVKSFTIPVSLVTRQTEAMIDLSVFACRFDGCVFETELNIPYKNEITFADQVNIYDRYEWEYEWEDDIYHVQEVLLNFPYKDIKKVKLSVSCDTSGLYIATTERNRATCNNRRKYSNVYYRDYEVDEQGNVYNLLIESVTRNTIVETPGAVELEFVFINKRNRVEAVLYHRPMQEEVSDEDED